MSRLNTALERALPILAAAYGEQFGVNVVLSGTDAYTDGENIVLPVLDNMSELKDVLFGYLAHEAAHIRDSDFNVIKRCKSPLEKSFMNIIEDIRIEQLIQETFPGTQFTLSTCWDYVVAQGMSPPAKPDDNEATQLHQYLLHRLRSEYLNREASHSLAEASELVAAKTFPPGFFVRLDGLLGKQMSKLDSSKDCLSLARAILKALKEAEEEQQQEQASQDDQNSDANDDSPTGGEVDSQSSDDNDEGQSDPQQDSQGNQSDMSDIDDDTDGEGASLHERLLNESDLPDDAIDLLRGELADQARDDNDGDSFTIEASNIGDDMQNQGDTCGLNAGILASSAIRSRLIGLLAAQTRQQQRLHTRGKRVDGKRLARLASGDSRVFIQRDDVHRPETSVHVLLDCSGSMGNIQDIANQATVSLALAVSSIPKCDIACSMFPGINGEVSPMIHRGQPVRASLGRFAVSSSGGTPLAPAMLYAARELAQSKRQRKVMIIVTDGAPNSGGAVHYMNDLVKGYIDIYAIGIGSTAVSQYFEKWSVINNVKELQQALFAIAGQFLDLH